MNTLRRPHRWWSGSAFLAILLLSLLPTAGRLREAFAPGTQVAALAMCTAQGLAYRPISAIDGLRVADPLAPDERREPATQGDGDCAYCPLLASLDLPAPTAACPPPILPVVARSRSSASRAGTDARIGLGPRGPPRMHPAG
ncbi:MAG: DUF2946 family protein [Pseudomonadota bacterium]